ncbi:hypothetical protein [Acinetobacter sp.]|uniref:hypothetical protein n=1 Tax=Acinetobacter sp. TaxID=472 RepID=UPI00388D94EC
MHLRIILLQWPLSTGLYNKANLATSTSVCAVIMLGILLNSGSQYYKSESIITRSGIDHS